MLVTREPGGTPLAEGLRSLFLQQEMDPLTEALAGLADMLPGGTAPGGDNPLGVITTPLGDALAPVTDALSVITTPLTYQTGKPKTQILMYFLM